jgi:predicted tellurium resistance membrane protein TerC
VARWRIWLVAIFFAMAGFRKTAEAIDRFLDAIPTAIILLAVLVMAVVAASIIRWLTQPSSTQP